MRKKTVRAVQLTGHNAVYALQMLIEDGKIAGRDVVLALKRREKTVRELRARLTALGEDVSKAVRARERFRPGPQGPQADLEGPTDGAPGPGPLHVRRPAALEGRPQEGQGDSHQVGSRRGDPGSAPVGELGIG